MHTDPKTRLSFEPVQVGEESALASACGHDRKDRSMKSSFNAVFEPVLKSEGGGYVAYAEEVPGAISEGDTLDEAFEKSM
jgi:hypothetical protein